MTEIIATPMFLGDEDRDVLRFSLRDESRDVILSESNGASDLKSLFQWVLEKMVSDEVKVTYNANPEYSNGMYSNVCEEYVKSLESEMALVRERMVEEGLVDSTPADQEADYEPLPSPSN